MVLRPPVRVLRRQFRFRLSRAVSLLFVVGMLIPLQAVLVPLFSQMRDLHLLNTPWSLILVYTAFGLPLTVFLMESFIASFPDSIMEAAVIDGASVPRIFASVILPMSGPVVATAAILNFLNNWKEFSFALVFITDEAKKTLPLGLYNFLGAYTADYAGNADSPAAWQASRRRIIEQAGLIDISFGEATIAMDGKDRATLTFPMNYRSKRFEDEGIKQLQLVRDQGQWRIAREQFTAN